MAVSLVGTVVGLIVDTIDVIMLGKKMGEYVMRRKKGSREKFDLPRDQENSMKALISGSIGSRLMDAFISYVERGDSEPLKRVIDGVERKRVIDVSIDLIGRNPELMYRSQFGGDPDYVFKHVAKGSLSTKDFPLLARSSAKFLRMVNNIHPMAKKRLILAMPVVLGFQIGQLIGDNAKFHLLHMGRESGYEEIESALDL